MRRCKNCSKEMKDGIEICPYCGYINDLSEDNSNCLKSGTVIDGRYVIKEVQNTQRDSIFYISIDNASGQKVLIKEFFPSDLVMRESGSTAITPKDESKASLFEKGFNDFIDEATELSGSSSKNGLLNCIADNNTAYMIFEYSERNIDIVNTPIFKKALMVCLIVISVILCYVVLFRLFSGNIFHKSYSAKSFTQVVERMGARSVRESRVSDQDSKNDSEYYVILDAHNDDEYEMMRYRAGVSSYAIDPDNIEECIIYRSFDKDDDETATIVYISFSTLRDAERYYSEVLQSAMSTASYREVDDVPALFKKNENNIWFFSGYFMINIDADDDQVVYGCYVQGRSVIYIHADSEDEMNEVHDFCNYMRIPDPYDSPILWGD